MILFFLISCHSPSLAVETINNQEIQTLQKKIISLEETITSLSNEKQRQELIAQLNVVLSAKKEQLTAKEALVIKEERDEEFNFINIYYIFLSKVNTYIKNLGQTLSRLPKESIRIKKFFSKKENLYFLFDIGLKLLLSLLASLFIWFILNKFMQKWRISLPEERKFSLVQKVKSLFLNVFLESYYAAILFFFTWIFLKLTTQNIFAQAIIFGLGAWLIYHVMKSLCHSIFTPKISEQKLFTIDDQLSNYIFIWCRRVLLFSLYAVTLAKVASIFGLWQISYIIRVIFRIGLLIMFSIILAQWKEPIKKKLSFTIEGSEAVWKIKVKKIFNQIISVFYSALIIYFAFILLLYILGYKNLYHFFILATLKSFFILAASSCIWFLWDTLYKKFFIVKEEIKQRYPTIEKQVNQYITWIDHAAHFTIILITFLLFLQIWGLNIQGLLTQYSSYLSRLVRIPLIILLGLVSVHTFTFLINKTIKQISESRMKRENIPFYEIEKQMNTIAGIVQKTLVATIWLFTGMMVLKELGFSIGPLLAGAGIVGVAVGFGSQNLVRDVISGLFMIVENQVRVGDVAILNGTGGLVEQVNLRTTVLRGLDGTVHIFPNGSINTVSNMTHDFSYYLFNIGVAYKEDIDKVYHALKKISDEITQEEPYKSLILEPLEILGLDKFADSAIIIKARIKTKPIKQWQVGREMNKRIKERFDEEGIEIPFPHRSFYFGEASNPIDVNIKQTVTNELKDFILKAVKDKKIDDTQKRV